MLILTCLTVRSQLREGDHGMARPGSTYDALSIIYFSRPPRGTIFRRLGLPGGPSSFGGVLQKAALQHATGEDHQMVQWLRPNQNARATVAHNVVTLVLALWKASFTDAT